MSYNRYNNYENYDGYEDNENHVKRQPRSQEEVQKSKEEQRIKYKYGTKPAKEYFKDANLKMWRMIIRNLPYKTTRDQLQNVCSGFGTFTDIVLPPSKKKKEGCAGFAFVQFKNEEDAQKAKDYFNSNKFQGQSVAADWAIAKDTYETSVHQEKSDLKQKVKVEKDDDDKKFAKSRKAEESDEDGDSDEDLCDEEVSMSEDSDGDEEEVESGDSEEEDEEMDTDQPSGGKQQQKKGKVSSKDKAVEENRAVFLRNLSFDTTEEALKKAMSKYGKVELAILCKFHDSGHSKGTAFVHFSSADEATKCVQAAENYSMVLDERMINASLAVPRERAAEMEKEKLTKIPNDNRNLRLLRFGLIREGTTAAQGMSSEDAAKRVRLAEASRKKLENLQMFVSPVRLMIHNLPLQMTNHSLKALCLQAVPNADIKECRIWKDMNRLNDKGEGKSKGFAFVAFSEHQHALACLQKMNNNPTVFTKEKRPIVEFSIENIAALQAKERRLTTAKGEKPNAKAISEKVKNQVKESVGKVHAAGMKFLPKNLGKKNRHRDMSNNKKKKLGILSEKKKAKAAKPIAKAGGGGGVNKSKNNKNKMKKNTTKYLTMG